jgi:hypothetical protein
MLQRSRALYLAPKIGAPHTSSTNADEPDWVTLAIIIDICTIETVSFISGTEVTKRA